MVYFPERQPDGTWVAAEDLHEAHHATRPTSQIDGEEFELYRDVTRS